MMFKLTLAISRAKVVLARDEGTKKQLRSVTQRGAGGIRRRLKKKPAKSPKRRATGREVARKQSKNQ